MSRTSEKKSNKVFSNSKSDNPARSSTLAVVARAKYVRVDRRAIEKLADQWAREKVAVPVWSADKHYVVKDPRRQAEYIILLDALNFCFWPRRGLPAIASLRRCGRGTGERWRIDHHGEKIGGYFAMSLALKKFFDDPANGGLADFVAMSYKRFTDIFRGDGELQLLRKRWQIARAVARVITEHYNGDILQFITAAGGDAVKMTLKIAKELPSFDDTAMYHGHKIYLLKRAQILVADLFGVFGGKGAGAFRNMARLTAFPDYKLPQLFHHYGVFQYSTGLEKRIASGTLIRSGSLAEIEIRAATIWAAEWLAEELNRRGVNIAPYAVDWLLWNKSQNTKMRLPHHNTRTHFY